MKKIKLHPFVHQLLFEDKTISELLKKQQTSTDPVIQGLIKLHEALFTHDLTLKEKMLTETESLNLKDSDINLAIIFLRSRIAMLLDFNNKYVDKATALSNHIKYLMDESTPPKLKMDIDFFLSSMNENKNKHYAYYLKMINESDHLKNVLKKTQTTSTIKILARLGLLKDIKTKVIKELSPENLAMAKFTDAVEKIQISAANKELKIIKTKIKNCPDQSIIFSFFKYERWEYLLQIFTNNFIPISHTKILDDQHRCFLNANYYLLKNDIEKASKELEKYPVKKGFETCSFLSYTNVRMALAIKNAPLALTLLQTKQEYYKHYFDDFFYMRIQLMLGNKRQALLHFANLTNNCKHHNSNDLVAFELKLSREISPNDMWYFSNNISQLTESDLVEVNSSKKIKTNKLIGINRIIHKSPSSKSMCDKILQFAKSSSHILIRGETGVGKDIVAKAIHEESPNSKEPFKVINCGAISESILQSELFGHEAGAYTSALKKHIGIFEAAGHGTVFLDEIGETTLRIQIALLRVLENREGRPVGSNKVVKYSCRIVAATNANLEELIETKHFRKDLYFRLKSLEINISPLRERPDDIEAQARYYFNLNQLNGQKPKLSEDLITAFKNHPFYGNTRELKNAIQNARILNGEKKEYTLNDFEIFNTKKKKAKAKPINQPDNYGKPPLENYLQNAPSRNDLIIVRKQNQTEYRRDLITQLFQKYKRLSRQEITDTLRVTYKTAGTDMKALLRLGIIKKIEPTSSPRTHYFILNEKID